MFTYLRIRLQYSILFIYTQIILHKKKFSCIYNPQIQIFAESETKRPKFGLWNKTKRSKKERAHNKKAVQFGLLFMYLNVKQTAL